MNCVICGTQTPNGRKTCSAKCLKARQLELKKFVHDVITNQKQRQYFENYYDKKLGRREIEGVLNDL